jgi:hypothetical protein
VLAMRVGWVGASRWRGRGDRSGLRDGSSAIKVAASITYFFMGLPLLNRNITKLCPAAVWRLNGRVVGGKARAIPLKR